ncbi:MAG: hypothetical protein GEU90_03140 [Gemmatimonas sp.]|nr:hypothetical protein [Gemmatimonas sp.]
MATMNFSIPEDIKRVFNETFRNRNKSAIIADLMVRAVEEKERRQRRSQAIERLVEGRRKRPKTTDDQTRLVRKRLRR